MKWLKENVSLLTLFSVIISLCVYIYQNDRSNNKEEHQKLEVKIDKVIEKMDNNEIQKYERWEQIISDLQDSLNKKKQPLKRFQTK